MRKLAAVSLGLSAAVFAANYILPFGVIIPAALIAIAFAVLIPVNRLTCRYALFVLFGVAFGFLVFAAHHQLCGLKAESLEGQEREIHCVAAEYPEVYDDYCRVVVKLKSPGLPSCKALLYVNGQHISELQPGQKLSLYGKLKAADSRFGEEYDHYYTQGIYFSISNVRQLSIYSGDFSLGAIPVKLNRYIGNLVEESFPSDTSAFMKSLMLGDKTELYARTEEHTALTNAGLMHIVAVSGMHIAFLVGLFRVLFGYGAASSALALLAVWSFVFVSGMSPSAVRAGIMQSFILLAPVVRRENDSVTSISAALALILIINPYAAKSISLQLSFAATAGILFVSPLLTDAVMEYLPERGRAFVQTVCVSAAGMIFTVPLTAIHFGQISIYSVLSNILVLPVVSLCFCGGYAACLAASIFPALGTAVAWLDAWAARYILGVAKLVSRLPYATVFVDSSLIVLWLCLSYALFIVAVLYGRNTLQRLAVPLIVCGITLFAALGGLRLYYRNGTYVTAVDVGQGQCICVMSGENTIVVDCGNIMNAENAGKKAASYLRSRGREKLDVLILTHLHEDHANGVSRLAENMEIDNIIYSPESGSENEMLSEILSAAEKNGSRIFTVESDSSFELGAINVKLIPPESLVSDEACLVSLISIGDYDVLITGDSDIAAEKRLSEKYELGGTELYIVGHHGSRYSSSEELLKELGGHTAIVSVGYNTYGHPTYETLERLRSCGYNIYRTDLNGNIEIRIG